jgi:hypothetical protein
MLTFFAYQHTRTPVAHAFHETFDVVVEERMKDWPREVNVAEVPRAKIILLLAGRTDSGMFQYAHTGVKESIYDGVGSTIRIGLLDLYDRATPNLIWTQDTELNTTHHIYILVVRQLFVDRHVSVLILLK